ADESEREREALLLATGHAAPRRRASMAQADALEQHIGILGMVVVRREEMHGLAGMDPWIDTARLQHRSDASDERVVICHRIESEHPNLSGRRPPETLECLDRGGLARTVGAEQREHLARTRRERDVIDRSKAAIPDDELVHVDHAHRSTLVGS